MLNADAILAAQDQTYEVVDVPEWGGTVRVRGLTASERDKFDRDNVRVDSRGQVQLGRLENLRALLVVKCLVDENGERLFSDRQAGQLGDKSSVVVGRLYDVASRLSGMRVEEQESEEEIFVEAQDGATSSE